ncbi:hypothetical protein WJX73_000449 [Symbiochloris irregularis]|uniref:Uncharacterized protein n=1 Tax=Symbiochloris irregularis TaxID=706552 RepID=A0AAW1P7C9_9CHLO
MQRVARELEARGHDVWFVASQFPSTLESLQKLGIPPARIITFEPATSVDLSRVAADLAHAQHSGDVRAKHPESLYDYLADTVKGIANATTLDAIKAIRPDVVVADLFVPHGLVLADALKVPKSKGLWQRIDHLYRTLLLHRQLDILSSKYTKAWKAAGLKDADFLTSAQESAAVILQGSFAVIPAFPLSPHMHLVGAFTPEPAKALPSELQRICDSAAETGLVYVAFGNTGAPGVEMVHGLYDALVNITQPVIWVISDKDQQVLKDAGLPKPRHHHYTAYAPQNDILGHPSVTTFVTQGGTNSCYEALYHGVRQVIIPIFFEQPWHADQVPHLGAGLRRAADIIEVQEELTPLRIVFCAGRAFSHSLPQHKVARELEARGHDTWFLASTFPGTLESLHQLKVRPEKIITFEPLTSATAIAGLQADLARAQHSGNIYAPVPESFLEYFANTSHGITTNASTIEAVRAIQPDVIVAEMVATFGLAVADVLKVPKVMMSAIPPVAPPHTVSADMPYTSQTPTSPFWHPQPMGLWQRIDHLYRYAPLYWQLLHWNTMLTKTWQVLGLTGTDFLQSARECAAWIWQGSFAVIPAYPLSPHIHMVGAITPEPAQALPDDLQRFCDSAADNGVVYVSFGTTGAPGVEMLHGVHKALATIPQAVIWVVTEKDQQLLGGAGLPRPKHHYYSTFVPQNDILGHPSVTTFVTQGGTNSFFEALYHGVRPVVIPLFYEQVWYADQVQHLGAGMRHIGSLMRSERQSPTQKAADIIEAVGWSDCASEKSAT